MSEAGEESLWERDPSIPEDAYVLRTKLMTIILWEAIGGRGVWRCELLVKEHAHDCEEEFIDIVDVIANSTEEAKGKAIFAAFDLVIAYAFASREA